MDQNELEQLRFPVGRFQWIEEISASQRTELIAVLRQFPEQLKKVVENFEAADFKNTYRPDGWTAAQVIHHLADSHMHSYLRFKHTYTEDTPTITPYDEGAWSCLSDGSDHDVQASLKILEGVHHRWCQFLDAFTTEDFDRKYYHPQLKIYFSLNQALALYAWHCKHHLEHVKNCKITA